jgi:SAM-dependent methyltransferase
LPRANPKLQAGTQAMAKSPDKAGLLWDRWSERKHYNRSHLGLYYQIRARNLRWLASLALSRLPDKKDLRILKTDLWDEAKKDDSFYIDTPGLRLGIDVSGEVCKRVQSKYRGQVSVVKGTIESIPFMANSLDLICDISTIDHCNYPEKAINEYCRTLKSNGILLLVAENPFCFSYPVTKIQSFFGLHVPFKGFLPSRIKRGCRKAGLEIVDHFKTNVHLPTFIVYSLERKGLLEKINRGRDVFWNLCKKYFVTIARKL